MLTITPGLVIGLALIAVALAGFLFSYASCSVSAREADREERHHGLTHRRS